MSDDEPEPIPRKTPKKRSGPSMREQIAARRLAEAEGKGGDAPAAPRAAAPKPAAPKAAPKAAAPVRRRATAPAASEDETDDSGEERPRRRSAGGSRSTARRAGGGSSRRRRGDDDGDDEGGERAGRRGRREPQKKSPLPLIAAGVLVVGGGAGAFFALSGGGEAEASETDGDADVANADGDAAGETANGDGAAADGDATPADGEATPAGGDGDGAAAADGDGGGDAADADGEAGGEAGGDAAPTPAADDDGGAPTGVREGFDPTTKDTRKKSIEELTLMIDALEPLPKPDGVDDATWASAVENAKLGREGGGRRVGQALDELAEMREVAFPAVVNELIDMDFSDPEQFFNANAMTDALARARGSDNKDGYGWHPSTPAELPEDRSIRFSLKLVVQLHQIATKIQTVEGYWLDTVWMGDEYESDAARNQKALEDELDKNVPSNDEFDFGDGD